MSLSFNNRKKARKRELAKTHGDGYLIRSMRKDPLSYPRWIQGASVQTENGIQLISKCFWRKGTWNAQAGGHKKFSVVVTEGFKTISTLAFQRSQRRV